MVLSLLWRIIFEAVIVATVGQFIVEDKEEKYK